MALTMIWVRGVVGRPGLRRRGRTAGCQQPAPRKGETSDERSLFALVTSSWNARASGAANKCGVAATVIVGAKLRMDLARAQSDQANCPLLRNPNVRHRTHGRVVRLDTGRGGGSILFTE